MQTDVSPFSMVHFLWKKEKYFHVKCRAKRESFLFLLRLCWYSATVTTKTPWVWYQIIIAFYSYNTASMNCIHFKDRGFVLKIHNFNRNKSFVSVMDCIRKVVSRSRSACFQRLSSTILFLFFLFFPAGFPIGQTCPFSYLWLLLRMTPKSKLTVISLFFFLVGLQSKTPVLHFTKKFGSYKTDSVIRKTGVE